MAGQNSDYVGVGKPLTQHGGAVWYAKRDDSVELPTDAVSDIPSNFACVGYISENGLVEAQESDQESILAWGGDQVLITQVSYEKTYEFSMIETTTDSLKLVWGNDNVTEDANGLPVVDHTTVPKDSISMIIEMQITDDMIRRTVVPKAKVGEVGEITYADGEAVGYDVTVSALPVDNAVAHDYYAMSSSTSSDTEPEPDNTEPDDEP